MKKGAKTIADLFVENDRPIYTEKVFENIADFIEKNNLLPIKDK